MYRHILLPTDGSELSERAVKSGVQLAKALGAKVTGLSVVVEPLVAGGLGELMTGPTEAISAAEVYVGVIAREAQEHGVAHECYYVRGPSVSEEIVKAATARSCDLICMASHGRRGIAGLLLASETMHVLTHCGIPVLVYR